MPQIQLVNPSTQSFGVAVIAPCWLYACRRLFLGKPMPDLTMPGEQRAEPALN
jgi:hypothetical protein